jgi:cytoplasmic iron level regulating protein YaaA (DUF328/UPF0246 family)
VLLESLDAALATADIRTRERILGVKGARLDVALGDVHALREGTALVMKAWQRYSGVVWQHLEPATVPATARRRWLIPSGVYGLTTGEDCIADYRLKMSVVLPTLGNVGAFWRAPVTANLIKRCRGAEVVSLLPSEHAKAIDFAALEDVAHVRHVSFVSPSDQGVVGHAAKAVKGVVARQVALHGVASLRGFRWEGWRVRVERDNFVVVAPK